MREYEWMTPTYVRLVNQLMVMKQSYENICTFAILDTVVILPFHQPSRDEVNRNLLLHSLKPAKYKKNNYNPQKPCANAHKSFSLEVITS